MKNYLLFLSALLYVIPSLTHADSKIYHWVDAEGKTHFSDTAAPGTEELNLKEINLVTSGKKEAAEVSDSIAEQLTASSTDDAIINYTATIVSPTDDQALRSNEGNITIHVAIEPEKENEQMLQLYLDGIKLGSPQISPTILAQNIDRGTHQVQVELLDENGKVLTKTQVVTVHLQRAPISK